MSEFQLKLMTIDGEMLGIPDTDYQAVVNMPAAEFQRICRDMTILGDSVIISVTKEGVKFGVDGDIGAGSILVKQNAAVDTDPDDSTTISLSEPVELTFALRYLNFFTKASPLAASVTLSLSPDVPLMVEYGIGELGHIRYYLAPKLDTE